MQSLFLETALKIANSSTNLKIIAVNMIIILNSNKYFSLFKHNQIHNTLSKCLDLVKIILENKILSTIFSRLCDSQVTSGH